MNLLNFKKFKIKTKIIIFYHNISICVKKIFDNYFYFLNLIFFHNIFKCACLNFLIKNSRNKNKYNYFNIIYLNRIV